MLPTTWRRRLCYAAAPTVALMIACVDAPFTPTPTKDALGVSAQLANKPPLDITLEGEAWVCEDGAEPAGTFAYEVSVDGGPPTTHNVARGTCVMVHSVPTVGSTRASVAVSEITPADWNLQSVTIESNLQNRPDLYEPAVNSPTASATIRNDVGVVITFINDRTAGFGCTRTPGYWKTHAGTHKVDVVTPLLPIWLGTPNGTHSIQVTTAAQAVFILNHSGDASNGIYKLRLHLLAAKLNFASGASGSAVSGTVTAADGFLAAHGDWSALSASEQAQVLAWKDALDEYNNGLTGPGHCN